MYRCTRPDRGGRGRAGRRRRRRRGVYQSLDRLARLQGKQRGARLQGKGRGPGEAGAVAAAAAVAGVRSEHARASCRASNDPDLIEEGNIKTKIPRRFIS